MAETVVKKEQILNGKVLEVKRLGIESEKENVEKLRNKKTSREKESATVMVSELPEGSTKSNVHVHFQKTNNGGGEVKEVEMLGEGKAMVTFEDPRGRLIIYYDSKHEQDQPLIACQPVDFVDDLFSISCRCQDILNCKLIPTF